MGSRALAEMARARVDEDEFPAGERGGRAGPALECTFLLSLSFDFLLSLPFVGRSWEGERVAPV